HTGDKLSAYMTLFMKKTTEDASFDFGSFETLFKRVLRLLEPLGSEVFRGFSSAFSTSYYDAVAVGIATNVDYYEKVERSKIEQKIKELRANPMFLKNVGAGSSTRSRVINRIRISLQTFKPE
ncbi:MAG TPA: hypothetical protein VFD03_08240, partial [Clostridia bacterium]|nr:hypothetical protein [Clostridia bacterium]